MAKGNDASRTIPPKVSDAVKYRDYYRCLWCGTHLYERHHILEFYRGGTHTVDNLALLCPNCHTLIHKKGIIDPLDLVERMQKQKKCDRLNGLIIPDIEVNPEVIIGTVSFKDCNPIITYKGQPLLSYKLSEADELLISYKFYNINGELVFWMHDNSFWHSKDFICVNYQGNFKITSRIDSQFLSIEKTNDETLKIYGLSYLYGRLISFNEAAMHLMGMELKNIRFEGFGNGGLAL